MIVESYGPSQHICQIKIIVGLTKVYIWATSWQNQQNDICPVWSESSLCTQWVAKDLSFLHADSEDSDQTGRMPRMIWGFTGRTCHFAGFVMRRLIYAKKSQLAITDLLFLHLRTFHKLCSNKLFFIWATSWQNQQNSMWAQRRLRSAWPSAQSDQSLRCPHEETLGPQPATERKAKTQIRLGGCPGWSESSLGAHAILVVLSRGGSFVERTNADFILPSLVPAFSTNKTPNLFWVSHSLFFLPVKVPDMRKVSRSMTKPTKWPVRPAKTQISLGIHTVWSEFSLGCPGWSESSLSAWIRIGS